MITVVDVEFNPSQNPISISHQLSHLITVPHIHLAMATKPPQLINYEASIKMKYEEDKLKP